MYKRMYIMYKLIKKAILNFLIGLLVLFMFLSMIQSSDHMDEIVAMQFKILNGTINAAKMAMLYPYMSTFVDLSGFISEMYPPPDNQRAADSKPIRKDNKKKNNILQQLYYIVSSIFVVDKKLILLFLIFIAGISFTRRINPDHGFVFYDIRKSSATCADWIYRVLTLLEKHRSYIIKQYSDNVLSMIGKKTRTLDVRYGVRVFFIDKQSTYKIIKEPIL